MGSIAELVYHERKDLKLALLFDEIPGHPKGSRCLFGQISLPLGIATEDDPILTRFESHGAAGRGESESQTNGGIYQWVRRLKGRFVRCAIHGAGLLSIARTDGWPRLKRTILILW